MNDPTAPPESASGAARRLAQHFATDADARRLTRTALACVALVYANLAAAALALVPPSTSRVRELRSRCESRTPCGGHFPA